MLTLTLEKEHWNWSQRIEIYRRRKYPTCLIMKRFYCEDKTHIILHDNDKVASLEQKH